MLFLENGNLIFWPSFFVSLVKGKVQVGDYFWRKHLCLQFIFQTRPVLRYYREVSTAVFNENQLKSNIAENVTGFPNTDYESPPYQAQIGL